jgi:hypothetical protein
MKGGFNKLPFFILRNCHSHTTFSSHHPDQSAASTLKQGLHQQKDYDLFGEGLDDH